jgi:hypothetical protein
MALAPMAPATRAHPNQIEAWRVSDPSRAKVIPGPPAAVLRGDVATLGSGPTASRLLTAHGLFDDLDLTVTIEFEITGTAAVYAGFEFRTTDAGSYRFVISARGQFRIGTWVAPSTYGTFVPWTVHPALRTEPRARNRVRLIAIGKQIRVELNEVPASSVTLQQQYAGSVSLFAGCETGPLRVVFSDLVMRDPRG